MAYQKLQVSDGLNVIPSATVRIPDPSSVVILAPSSGDSKGSGAFDVAGRLTDTGNFFLSSNIKAGAIIYNTTAGIAYNVVSVDSDTEITISPSSAGGALDNYTIYNNATKGCILFVGTGGTLDVQMAAQNGNTTEKSALSNNELRFANIADGQFLPIQVVRVSTSVASNIIALW